MTSLRDLYALGGRPEAAGGDFGPEAHALGTMTARMHLALDRAFDRHPEPVSDWVDAAEAAIAAADPALLEAPGMADLTKALRAADARLPVIRTHGDFHLGRTSPHRSGVGGQRLHSRRRPPGSDGPVSRSPWPTWPTFCGRSTRPAWRPRLERDPTGRLDLAPLGQAWETRNRRAVLNGYLNTPGITGLTGPDRDVVRNLVAIFELVRSLRTS